MVDAPIVQRPFRHFNFFSLSLCPVGLYFAAGNAKLLGERDSKTTMTARRKEDTPQSGDIGPGDIGPGELRSFRRGLGAIADRASHPDHAAYLQKLRDTLRTLESEPEELRPRDSRSRPGGLIFLAHGRVTVVVPDLHARMDLLLTALDHRISDGATVLDGLSTGRVQLVCVGDGFHAEARAAGRWRKAFEEFKRGYRHHRNMDDEMRESLGLMEIVIDLKRRFPTGFHFLKGNHENIANEDGDGNYPFGKFAFEGEMVTEYVKKFYGEPFLETYYRFEKALPLLAVGSRFLVSHAEPARFYPREQVIDYRSRPQVVYGLTWTADDAAEPGSVERMLEHYLGADGAGGTDATDRMDGALYFGGHRSIRGRYNLRAGGRYVQLHNPERRLITVIGADGRFDFDRDIVDLASEPTIVEPTDGG